MRHYTRLPRLLSLLLLWVFPLFPPHLMAQSSGTMDDNPVLQIPRVTTPPHLADFLDNQRRPQELRVSDFRQREPKDGIPATLETSAFLSYDDRNLYVVFVCKDQPQLVRAHMSKRDDISGDDSVSVMIDAFHDRHRAYMFFSNPLGVQRDGITTEGQSDDYNFDTVWSSEGRLTRDGYAVWIAIPL